MMLPTTSPALSTLRLKLDLWFYELPFNGCSDFTDAMQYVQFPALETLDFYVAFRTDQDYGGDEDESEEMDFTPFLLSHPKIVDLSLWAIGTDLLDDMPLFANLRAFKGAPADIAPLLTHQPKQLESLHITLVHRPEYNSPSFYIPELPTHTGLTKLTVTATKADGSTLKHPDEIAPTTLASLASSFPNLKYLDICLSNPLSDYVAALSLLKKLETLRIREYRRKQVPPRKLLANVFPYTRFSKPIWKHLVHALAHLTSVELFIFADDRAPAHTRVGRCACGHCYSYYLEDVDEEEEEQLEPAKIEIEYSFGIARPALGEPRVVLERSNFRDTRYSAVIWSDDED
ncbi:hypothetical protein C8F01DRAFT_258948 [Mycena amicta]|nr:hypothetical protein C8F01DRAFT_258948 [Mycena amicta]